MGTLLYSATMSLDGFIAGTGGDMSWLTEHLGALDVDVDALMSTIGALLVGRRTFGGDDPHAGTDSEGAFGGRWQGPTVVLTHRPPTTPVPGVRFETDLAAAVGAARRGADGRYVNVLGADVARQCLEAGLLEEVLVFVAPVLLGGGTRMFDAVAGAPVRLDRIPTDDEGLRYRVRY